MIDILFGAFLGLGMAILSYRTSYVSLLDPITNHIPLPLESSHARFDHSTGVDEVTGRLVACRWWGREIATSTIREGLGRRRRSASPIRDAPADDNGRVLPASPSDGVLDFTGARNEHVDVEMGHVSARSSGVFGSANG